MSNKIPKDYFEKLSGQIMGRIEDMKDDLEVHAPILSRIERVNMYRVPDQYFSTLPERINTGLRSKVKLRKLFTRITIAASISLLLFFGHNYSKTWNQEAYSLADAEIMEYYLDNAYMLDENMLSYIEEEIQEEPVNYLDGIGEEALETYLSTIVDELSINELAIIEEL